MWYNKTKWIKIINAPIGTIFNSYRTLQNNYFSSSKEYIIKEIMKDNNILCEIKSGGSKIFEPNIEIEVPKTEEEYKQENFQWAKMIAAAVSLGCELYPHPWDEHEMWNAWIDCDPYDMAEKCRKENLMPLGWFKIDDMHSAGIGYANLDIGIVAEDLDRGHDIWCHASSDYYKHWPEIYPELYKE